MLLKSSGPFLACSLFAGAILLSAAPAWAQKYAVYSADTQPSSGADGSSNYGLLVLGAGIAPHHMGTNKYTSIPFLAGSYRSDNRRYTTRGLGVDINLNAGQRFSYGPIIHWRPKVKHSHSKGRAKQLSNIKGTPELGGFIGYQLRGDSHSQGRINLQLAGMHDVGDTHKGFLLTGRADYAVLRTRALNIDARLETSWASSDFQQTYFGVKASESRRSGLKRYRPGSGFRDVTAGLTLSHQITSSFGVLTQASLTRLVGPTAGSPIVGEASKNTALMGVAATWNF